MRHNYRLLWTTLGVAVAFGLLMSTGGFSAASMDRGVSVSVGEHENAMVSIWDPGGPSPEPPAPFGGENPVTPTTERATVVVIQNGVSGPIDVSVTSAADSPVSVHGTVSDVQPGEVVPVAAVVDCSDVSERAPVTVTLHVQVDGSVHATIQYEARIVCAGAPGNSSNAAQSNNSSTATPATDSTQAFTASAT